VAGIVVRKQESNNQTEEHEEREGEGKYVLSEKIQLYFVASLAARLIRVAPVIAVAGAKGSTAD
jgi:hypothetical protein